MEVSSAGFTRNFGAHVFVRTGTVAVSYFSTRAVGFRGTHSGKTMDELAFLRQGRTIRIFCDEV